METLWGEAQCAAGEAVLAALRADDLEAALVGVEGAAPEDASHCRAELDRWGRELSALRAGNRLSSDAEGLRRVLVQGAGLRGSTDDYYQPANSHLSRVVQSRAGLPILVSAVWMLVGRRAGVAVDGVPLPRHFVARVGGPEGEICDPFGGGRPLGAQGCRRLVEEAGGSFDPADLAPASTLAIIQRVLRNLVRAQQLHGSQTDLYRALRMAALVDPQAADLQLDLARISEELGLWEAAARLYKALCRAVPASREAQIAAIQLVHLDGRARTLN
jgi:regulator of sirC expression with transglutaminase-like and TPR domain